MWEDTRLWLCLPNDTSLWLSAVCSCCKWDYYVMHGWFLEYFHPCVKNLDDSRNGSGLEKLFWMHDTFVKINSSNNTQWNTVKNGCSVECNVASGITENKLYLFITTFVNSSYKSLFLHYDKLGLRYLLAATILQTFTKW